MVASAPSTTSSLFALFQKLKNEHRKRPIIAKTAVGVFAGAVAVKFAWSMYSSHKRSKESAEEVEAFRPLSAGERFDVDMRRVEGRRAEIKAEIAILQEEREAMKRDDWEDESTFRGAWRKASYKRYIELDERITKLLIEVDGIGIPSELVVDAIEESQDNILTPALDARHRRKDLIRSLHTLSVALNELQ